MSNQSYDYDFVIIGSEFWRLLMLPLAHGRNAFIRILKVAGDFLRHPIQNIRVYFVWNWAKRTQILLFMQTIDSTLRFTKGRFCMNSSIEKGKNPTAFIPEAKDLAQNYAKIVNAKAGVLLTETVFGIPTTAHILGGAIMGKNIHEGVIDKDNKVFGYQIYVYLRWFDDLCQSRCESVADHRCSG